MKAKRRRPAWPIGVLLVAATCAGAEPVVHENVTYLPTNRVEQLTIAVPEGPGPFPCVMVVPGGGWGELAGHHQRTAVWLAENGFVGVVVEYHVPGGLGKDKSYERPSPLAGQPAIPQALYDLQAAIRFVRANAGTYRVDPARIGAVGFSAGGWSLSEVGYAKPGYTYANDRNPDHPWRYDDKNQPYADQSCDMKALVLSSGHSHVKQIIRDPDRTRPVPTMILCAPSEHREDNLKELETVFQSAGVEFLHGTSPQAKHAPDITPGKRGANAMVFKLNNGRQGPACVLVLDFLRRHLGAPTP